MIGAARRAIRAWCPRARPRRGRRPPITLCAGDPTGTIRRRRVHRPTPFRSLLAAHRICVCCPREIEKSDARFSAVSSSRLISPNRHDGWSVPRRGRDDRRGSRLPERDPQRAVVETARCCSSIRRRRYDHVGRPGLHGHRRGDDQFAVRRRSAGRSADPAPRSAGPHEAPPTGRCTAPGVRVGLAKGTSPRCGRGRYRYGRPPPQSTVAARSAVDTGRRAPPNFDRRSQGATIAGTSHTLLLMLMLLSLMFHTDSQDRCCCRHRARSTMVGGGRWRSSPDLLRAGSVHAGPPRRTR